MAPSADPKNRPADGSDPKGSGGAGAEGGAEQDPAATEEAARIERVLAEHTEMRADLAELVEFLGKKFPKDLRENEEVNDALKRLLTELLDRRKNASTSAAAPARPVGSPRQADKRIFRVTADGQWADPKGGIHKAPKGKVFHAQHYDIELIRACGVQLEDVTPKK